MATVPLSRAASRMLHSYSGAKMAQTISQEQTLDPQYLKKLFARAQMSEFVKNPLLMAKAEGMYYWDINGKKYLDGISGIYTVNVGHANPTVIERIRKQMEVLSFSPPMHGSNPVAVQLANKLLDLGPSNMKDGAVKLLSGGSEATEAAIKMARQYHKLTGNPTKYKIISRYQSWHGSTLGSLSAGGLCSRQTVSEPLAPGFIKVFPPTCYRCPFAKQYPECDITCASLIENVIEMEGSDTIAAVMLEPIGHTGGILHPPQEYLPLIREICDRHNVLLIFDEIITGVGRTGEMFAAQTLGVEPDILCTGKGMSGGYAALAATMCSDTVASAFWGDIESNPGFVEGHTFEGNPISCVAGLAVIDEILEQDLLSNTKKMGARLRQGLLDIDSRHGIFGDIRGAGLFLGVELVKDKASKQQFDPPIGLTIGSKALERGLLCRFDPHWMAFGPALVANEETIDELLCILEESISATLEGQE